MRVLVTGAAGYIGSHVALALEESGHEVVRLDDLSTGNKANLLGRPCVTASLSDGERVAAALVGVDAVAHLAGSALVPESVRKPELYWRNNVASALTLLECMRAAGTRRIVFSSTCAVYGLPARVPIPESCPLQPVTPYGSSKAAVERLIRDMGEAHGIEWTVFRYFNAAGAHPTAGIGELHEPETHLIPLALEAIAGHRPPLTVFGTDHETPDGTCIRDYVDVRDIASAHVLALQAMAAGELRHETFNLGHGKGRSVREVLRACGTVTGQAVPVVDGERRIGDPPVLVADARRARTRLGWKPAHDLDDMIHGAWRFVARRASTTSVRSAASRAP